MNKSLFLTTFLISFTFTITLGGCGGSDKDFRKSRPYKNDPVISLTAAPKEGWATDPHLSYRLFSYYPTNYYNNGIYGRMGLYGMYYH